MSFSTPDPGVQEGAVSGPPPASGRRRWTGRVVKVCIAILGGWLVLAYLILPALWRHYEHNPALADAPKTTVTKQGIPGDPLNVGLVGAQDDVVRAMLTAGWRPADPVTLRSSVRIATSVVFKRPDLDAPVSSLFLFGRSQDLAFEKPYGGSARRRNHVRFWKWVDPTGVQAAPLWIGAATFDRSVGFSHLTGQVTHHIAADIDHERDTLFEDLKNTGWLKKIYQVTGVGATLVGRNGGGDRYYTDGELTIGVLAPEGSAGPLRRLANPSAVALKEQLWSAIGPLLKATSADP